MPDLAKYLLSPISHLKLRKVKTVTIVVWLLCAEVFFFSLSVIDNPSLSMRTLFIIPASIAAWLLNPIAAFTFALLSASLRTLNFHIEVVDGNIFNKEFFLNLFVATASYMGMVAIIQLIRSQLLRRSDELAKTNAKLTVLTERNERSSQIRRATMEDINGLVDLTILLVDEKVITKQLPILENRLALIKTYTDIILTNNHTRQTWDGKRTSVKSEIWVAELSGQVCGMMIILDLENRISSDLEVHLIGVSQKSRGKGIGSSFIEFFLQHYSNRKLFGACRQGSAMEHILKKYGFVSGVSLPNGYTQYIRSNAIEKTNSGHH